MSRKDLGAGRSALRGPSAIFLTMTETGSRRGSAAVKALALLPLLLMGGGVWYYLKQHSSVVSPAPEAAAEPALGAEPAASPAASPAKKIIPPGTAADPMLALDIRGSAEFQSQMTNALKRIWLADRELFLSIKNSLSAIRSESKTDFYMDNGKPVAAISNKHAFKSVTWCAGIIAHQAWHASYAMSVKKKKKFPPPLPGGKYERKFDANPMLFKYTGLEDVFELEARASEYQLRVLKTIGAPAAETRLLLRRAPRDLSTGHDGNYSLRP